MVRPKAVTIALLCAGLGLAWQLLTVHFNYGGNFTALFCHGSQYPAPADLANEHIYVFPNSGGYDGQSYHYVAHDPLCRTAICRAVPDPALRYPRILVPGMAHVLALGRAEWIDGAYFACNLFFLFLGVYWLAHLCERSWLAALYLLAPATLISLDRMVVDLALTSLCLGFAVYLISDSRWKLYLIIAAAALCREAGFALFVSYAVRLAVERRFARTALFATAILPAVLWICWVRVNVPGGGAMGPSSLIPFTGLADALRRPRVYGYGAFVIRGLEMMQLGGMLLGMGFAITNARKFWTDPIRTACFLWALLGVALPPGVYDDPFGGVRVLSPMLMLQFLGGKRLPLAVAAPRVWLQLGPQIAGVLRGIF
jgi:hypothetical protein